MVDAAVYGRWTCRADFFRGYPGDPVRGGRKNLILPLGIVHIKTTFCQSSIHCSAAILGCALRHTYLFVVSEVTRALCTWSRGYSLFSYSRVTRSLAVGHTGHNFRSTDSPSSFNDQLTRAETPATGQRRLFCSRGPKRGTPISETETREQACLRRCVLTEGRGRHRAVVVRLGQAKEVT